MPNDKSDSLWTAVLGIVGLAVLAGFVRLLFSNWTYVALVVVVIVIGYVVGTSVQKERR